MEAGEEKSGIANLKRQREPLSDSDDSNLSASESVDAQKRRRLAAGGQENHSPTPSTSRRLLEQEATPTTPAVPSVRARVQQLSQRTEGGGAPVAPGAPRCFSDPRADDKCSSEKALGELQFSQRRERFLAPPSQGSPAPTPSSAHGGPLTRSDFVSVIQQKLQGATTPSSKQASRLRQEREEELNQLQPIRDNAWLKRSHSDPALTQVCGEADLKDASFTEPSASTTAGGQTRSEGEAHRLHQEVEQEAGGGPEEPPALKLSFSEEQNPSELQEDSERLLQQEVGGAPRRRDQDSEESSPEDSIEPSTDEEFKMWRYPSVGLHQEVEEEERGPPAADVHVKTDEVGTPECAAGLWSGLTEPPPPSPGDTESQSPGGGDVGGGRPEETDHRRSDGVKPTGAPQQGGTTGEGGAAPSGTDGAASDQLEAGERGAGGEQGVGGEPVPGSERSVRGQSAKKVTFILEPELILGSKEAETSVSDGELSTTCDIIDHMFGEVLQYAEEMEEEEDPDSGIETFSSSHQEKTNTEPEKEQEEEQEEEQGAPGEELLTFPPSGILSPLGKSIEAAVTPLRLVAGRESDPPSVLLPPEESSTPPAESAPLYSVDAYRTQRQSRLPPLQTSTPGVLRRAPDPTGPPPSVSSRDRITALTEEASKLQTVISQTLQALSCCTDEDHGRGSVEEAEAEKLLLVSCEKRSALLAEVSRLREERSWEEEQEEQDYISQQPCRGTVTITDIQLPLKVEFVCSSHGRAGRPSHYFFILIRYGPSNMVATPLATAADAQTGDTISFPTSVTLKDIRSTFEIDVEVYSLSHTPGSSCSVDRTTAKSRVTPRKLLSSITRSSHSLMSAPPALAARRSSNFSLVGSHRLTLASLGRSKFPLDKMKFEGKVRRLLGDEFQEKVPFLSPLEGSIYLQLASSAQSGVQHGGFLTRFELLSGFGVWNRRYFVLEGCKLHYWNHPNDRETKEAEGSLPLSSASSQSVRPVKRDLCARPFTFELQSGAEGGRDTLDKCWFSADTKQERLDWMEKLSQALLDFHTWSRLHAEEQNPPPSTGSLRESAL